MPIEGLFCLLWDVSENRHRRVIKSLQDRSIIDFKGGEYWLHPVIREEAVIRLRITEDWKTSNQKAAEFWTISVKAIETVPDALKALEAYYHYINISDFETAASIILRERDNRWQKTEIFGVSLYRLGLFQRLPSTLNEIVHHIQSNYYLSGIYHLIADSYALRGSLKEAVEFFERSGEIAEGSNIGYFKLASLQNIAVCKMELGDIETAIEYFEEVVKLSEITDSYKHGINARFCLAFLNSCQQNQTAKQKALELAEEVINEISNTDLSIDLTIWGKGYCWLYLGSTYKNLGRSKEALEFYRRAITFAEECNYPLVKADTLRHLASLYREEQDFETALDYHFQSIRLSEEVGSKADLAEACYQLGLTYYTIGEVIEGQKSFQEAIRLFNEMEAPKQVDKVRQAIQRHNNT